MSIRAHVAGFHVSPTRLLGRKVLLRRTACFKDLKPDCINVLVRHLTSEATNGAKDGHYDACTRRASIYAKHVQPHRAAMKDIHDYDMQVWTLLE